MTEDRIKTHDKHMGVALRAYSQLSGNKLGRTIDKPELAEALAYLIQNSKPKQDRPFWYINIHLWVAITSSICTWVTISMIDSLLRL